MKRRTKPKSTCLAICILEGIVLTSCGGTPSSSEATAVNRAAIVNGNEDQEPASIGIADVRDATSDSQAGTAVLLTNDWLLSAKHVVNRSNALRQGRWRRACLAAYYSGE